MKRTLFAVLLALLLPALCLTACAGETEPKTFTSGDYQYILLDHGKAEITRYTGNDEEIIIPDQLDGNKVTSIGDSAFSTRSNLISVTIPDSVTKVGANPFSYCEMLSKVTVSPDHPALAVIDGVLFSKQDKRLVCYPNGKEGAEYQIPLGIQIIGDEAFSFCRWLTSVTIPNSVTEVGSNPFKSCPKLTKVTVSPDHPALAVTDGVLFSKQDQRLICYPEGKQGTAYKIPSNTQIIGDSAFSFCTGLTSVTIPNGVTFIGNNAFSNCSSLTSITIPDSVTSIGNYAFSWCSKLTAVTIPHGVTFIGNSAFSSCSKLTAVTIPHGVTSIGFSTFSRCSSLTSITIPGSVTSIEFGAFSRCSSLTSITIPDSVTSIGYGAFSNCINLSSVTIPGSVTAIGEDVFSECPNLTLTVSRSSYAAQYCKENKLNYTYFDSLDWLNN